MMNTRLRIYRFGRKLNAIREFVLNFWFFKFQMKHPVRRAIELARNVI
jgi:hypothetical protein